MTQFKSRREPRAGTKTFFEHGRAEYLAAKVAPQVKPPRFCNALEEINEPLGNLYKRHGFPWITLVLGSGCLEAGQDISSTRIRDVPAIVRRLLAGQAPLPDGTNPAKFASAFAASLIADRLGSSGPASNADHSDIAVGPGSPGSPGSPVGPGSPGSPVGPGSPGSPVGPGSPGSPVGPGSPGSPVGPGSPGSPVGPGSPVDDSFDATTDLKTAKLLLCAALLTRLYHLASAAAPDALSRAGHDRATLHTGRAGSAELETDALKPTLDLLDELIASTNQDNPATGDPVLHEALSKIHRSLRTPGEQPWLRVADIQLLTELCWYALTQGTSVYPGWSDLLLHLSTRNSPALFDRWLPRPAFDDIDAACQFVEQRYAAATRLSWEQLVADDQSARERFYATVAGVLRQQAVLRRSVPQSSPIQPPIASAFVTSFDLELEMAMWRSGTEPFVVAVPMNLLQDVAEPRADHLASVCWLGCLIRPDHSLEPMQQLKKLRTPAESDWFLLSAEANYELTYGNYPVLVRMSGSPLMDAPRLWTEDGEWNDLCRRLLKDYDIQLPEPPDLNAPELRMAHVALLDEYSALQHAASEFYLYQPDGDSKGRVRHGLPAALTGTQGSAFARFWMMMGVQVSDSSIRYRFASQMTVPANIDGGSIRNPPTPSRAGLVVNWRTDDTVRDLLGWYNFDVVTDGCEKFQGDLQHYLRHLQSNIRKPSARKTCELT